MTLSRTLPDFCREFLGLPEAAPIKISPLSPRGSDRSFFRLEWNRGESAILIHYGEERIENVFYAEIAAFLREIGIAVPRVLRHDPAAGLILMEDLGSRDLWSYRMDPWENRRRLYQKTLTILHRLHSFPVENFPSDRVRLMEGFGPDLYRWERNYFMDHFIRGVCDNEADPPFDALLEKELASLGERLSATRPCLVHRDLQSQNVMIRNGQPFLIDFQGMRFGNLFYDLGSLLCDPYVTFSALEREELLSFYHDLWKGGLDRTHFRQCFWEASVQRLMQALGAYGFLGREKGLKAFLAHIPAAAWNLQEASAQVASLPHLQKLLSHCRRAIERTLAG